MIECSLCLPIYNQQSYLGTMSDIFILTWTALTSLIPTQSKKRWYWSQELNPWHTMKRSKFSHSTVAPSSGSERKSSGSLVPTLLHLTVTKTQSSIYAPSTLIQGSPCTQSGFSHRNQVQDLTTCNPTQNCSINLGFLWRMFKLKGEMLTENTLSCLKSVAT